MRIITLVTMTICCLGIFAQDIQKNSISTTLIRTEKNSQTLYEDFSLKFMNGIEYHKFHNKWSFGIKYEHGFNKIEEYPTNCYDCFAGTGYMREDNIYLTGNYAIFSFLNSRFKINTGLSLYYSNLNFSGDYAGGFWGKGTRINSTYNTFGIAPSLSIQYYPTERLFISINSNIRYGWSQRFDVTAEQYDKTNEYVITAPELRIGVNF